MDEADRVADRVAIIDHGELLVLDTPEALKRRVGEGDVVEIQIETPSPEWDQAGLLAALSELGFDPQLDAEGNTLMVRARNLVARLSEILGELERLGVVPGDVRLRENTLEDVFIQLTGRRLRE
jgi:ABC-2 type transport system ATP-binding protein